MKLQVLEDTAGNKTGVFVPMEDWNFIKKNYPDIESIDEEIPNWEKNLIDSRLEAISKNPERLRPISELFEELNRKI